MEKYKLETIFNDCLEKLLDGTATIEQCIRLYPEQANELEPMLRTAMSVNKAVSIEPPPDAKARVRYKLQLAMVEAGKPRRASWFSLQPRWALALMSLMLVFILGGGAVLAADSSMPGSPLYPVKLFTENISLKLAGSDMEKAELAMTLADRRVTEMNYLMENAKYNSKNVEAVATRYVSNLEQVNVISDSEEALIMSGSAMMESDAQAELAAPRATAPATSEDEKTYVEEAPVPEVTLEIPPETTSEALEGHLPVGSWNNLQQTIYFYGYSHVQQLVKWLNDPGIPEQYKPAIRRMIQDLRYLEQLQLSGKEFINQLTFLYSDSL